MGCYPRHSCARDYREQSAEQWGVPIQLRGEENTCDLLVCTIGVYPGSSWTIVDSEDVLGVNLNIKPKR